MSRQADLHPALGYPGGPCHVVERIDEEVRQPRLRDHLSDKVQRGDKLTNPEASKVYDVLAERGPGGLVKKIVITPHAQYRMDQRGVTVNDLRLSFKNLHKQFYDWKAQGDFRFRRMSESLARGEPVEWIDPKHSKLKTVFRMGRGGVATLITTFWDGLPDPRPGVCDIREAGIQPETTGPQTFVKNPKPQKSDTGKPKGDDGKYPTQALPSPPNSRTGPKKPPAFNGPGESGSNSDGTVHKDKVRTKGVPGGQYEGGRTHPLPSYNETGITPNRRPGLTADMFDEYLFDEEDMREAGMYPPAYPGANRQRDQRGKAKREDQKRYRRQRGKKLRDSNRRHRRLRTNNKYIQDRKRRDERPDKFERRPGGGTTDHRQRAREDRREKSNPSKPKTGQEESREAYTVRTSPRRRQRRQRGVDKRRARLRYRRNRVQNKLRSKRRYKRLKKNPAFKRQQKIRRTHPERFKRRVGDVLTAPEIAFVFLQPEMPLGYVRNISGTTGLVTYYVVEPGRRALQSLALAEFMRKVVFLSDEDIDAMYDLIDTEIGLEAYSDEEEDGVVDSGLVNLFTIESEFPHQDDDASKPVDPLLIDPTDDDFYYGVVHKLARRVLATFYREVRPPDMDPDQTFNRGTPLDEARKPRKKARKPGDPGFDRGEVMDSNPGSRVLPRGKGHVNKQAALIRDIRSACGADLLSRAEQLGMSKARRVRLDVRNAMWLFDFKGSKGTYRVRFQAMRKGNLRDIKKAHIRVSCSCPFWRWQGPEHWAKQGGYLYGKPQGTASRPSKKDPNGQNRACKHVLAVMNLAVKNKWSIPDPISKMAAFRYLADTLGPDEVEMAQFEQASRRLVGRYLASTEVQ